MFTCVCIGCICILQSVFQVADFFSGSGDHEKAAQLLVKTRHIEEALELCAAHNILITETMAEDMTLPKTDSGM